MIQAQNWSSFLSDAAQRVIPNHYPAENLNFPPKTLKNIFKFSDQPKICYLTPFQLGRDNFYHRNSISRDKA